MDIENKKKALRIVMRQKREEIPADRRFYAAQDAFEVLSSILKSHPLVLSFASFKDEIDTRELNRWLAKENRLLLPKIEQGKLQVYHVEHLKKQLHPNAWGIMEPNPKLCQKASCEEASFALVPGLAFDKEHHRLGFGKGHYDRLLSPLSSRAFGLGFREQYYLDSLPVENHDVRLAGIFLF